MKFFYGNIDFETVFKQRGCPTTLIDFTKHKDLNQVLKSLESFPGVIILTNIYQIKLFCEERVARGMIPNAPKESYLILGDLRFDYFRELKKKIATSIKYFSTRKNTGRIIMTAPMHEIDTMTLYAIQPTNNDYKEHLQLFEEVVPFVESEDDYIVHKTRSIHMAVSKKTLQEYIDDYIKICEGDRQYSEKTENPNLPEDPAQGSLPEINRDEEPGISPNEEEDNLPF